MAIAEQTATTAPSIQARPRRELREYPAPRPARAAVKIVGLIALAVTGAIAVAAVIGLGLLFLMVQVGS